MHLTKTANSESDHPDSGRLRWILVLADASVNATALVRRPHRQSPVGLEAAYGLCGAVDTTP